MTQWPANSTQMDAVWILFHFTTITCTLLLSPSTCPGSLQGRPISLFVLMSGNFCSWGNCERGSDCQVCTLPVSGLSLVARCSMRIFSSLSIFRLNTAIQCLVQGKKQKRKKLEKNKQKTPEYGNILSETTKQSLKERSVPPSSPPFFYLLWNKT